MKPLEVTIFHTNDVHGREEALSRLSAVARQLRAEAESRGKKVLFFDAGDAADRRFPTTSATKGVAYYSILNVMGYDVQTMGNAISLPYGPQAMKAVAERANFPILAANCRNNSEPLPEGLHEYVKIPLSPQITMGVLGLTAPWGNLYELFGLHMPDFIQVARQIIEQFKQEGVRPIVVLSHLGLDDDRRLSKAVPGIDLIIGAHSHHLLPEGEESEGVLIAMAGDYARALGRVELSLDSQTGEVLQRTARTILVPNDQDPDPLVVAAIEAAKQEVAAHMEAPIGVLESSLDLNHFDECGIGDLAADALRERMHADAAMVASGQFHAGLPAGTVTYGDLDQACFSSANPTLSEVSVAQIMQALERGLDLELARYEHHGFRGTPVGTPQISGMQVVFNPQAEPGQRVVKVTIGEDASDPQKIIRLAHTDAELSPEAGYLSLNEDQHSKYEVPTILPEVLEDYIRKHSPVPRPKSGRWVRSE
ncbi:MAG: bifunctional UDP-sugar hydrolase/5'-nucleotidase [Anaerolineales bacterium]|jgi:5'-nucleotidase